MAFRSRALRQIGAYDENCNSGEDQDMCFRLAKAGWELYFEPKAIVRHKARTTLRAFARQWFNYGFHHPYLFKKHYSRGLRVYRTGNIRTKGAIYRCVFSMRFPFPISVFLTLFLAMHILLALAILFAAIGLYIPAIIVGLAALSVGAYYFKSDINFRDPLQTVAFIFFRYAANLALLMGGLLGGIKLRTLYISATFDYKK